MGLRATGGRGLRFRVGSLGLFRTLGFRCTKNYLEVQGDYNATTKLHL